MAVEPNRAQRLDAWARRNPIVVLVLLLAVISSSLITIIGAGSRLRNAYNDRFEWRQQEYERLESLRAGMTLSKFEETLGSPIFVSPPRNGKYIESTFEGRDYWVQALHDSGGTVAVFSVTACDSDFKPTFTGPLGKVTLNKSTFASVGKEPVRVRYFKSGATANSNYVDEYGLGNPGLYKTFFLAIDDACPYQANYADMLAEQDPEELAFYRELTAPGEYELDDPLISAFRVNSIVNTYGEGAVGADPSVALVDFQLGVNRLLTRTIR